MMGWWREGKRNVDASVFWHCKDDDDAHMLVILSLGYEHVIEGDDDDDIVCASDEWHARVMATVTMRDWLV